SLALKPGFKATRLMVVQFLFQLYRIAYYSFAWSSLSQRHHQNHRVQPLVLLQTVPACCDGSVLQLRRGVSHPPPWQSDWTSNYFRLWVNPSLNPVLPSGEISAIRSGSLRSDAIHSFRAVDLP